jgi:small subunit ribosomal protein S9
VVEALTRATGRRKEAVCAARLAPGNGQWSINGGRSLEDYFPSITNRRVITEPLRLTNTEGRYDIVVKLTGGGVAGQAGALRHALSRALAELDPDLRPALKRAGFLRRDAREKERRKYGLKKARKAPQYSKR